MNYDPLTSDHLPALLVGATIYKHPLLYSSVPFEANSTYIPMVSFRVSSINGISKMIGLTITKEYWGPFPSPGDISRLFISFADLLHSGQWWIERKDR